MPSRALAAQIRRTVLEQSKRAHVGHIGSSLSIADILAVLYAAACVSTRARRPRSRPLRPVQGPRRAGAVLRAARDRPPRARAARHLLRATARCSARTPSTRSPASTSRPARSARGSRSAPARRSRRTLQGSPRRVVRAAQRRRVQRGLGLGGGHVRRPPPARRTWSRSSTSTASRRSATRATCSTWRPLADRWRAFGWDVARGRRPRRGRARSARSPTSTPTAGRRTCCSRDTDVRQAASRSWSAEIEWHYLPMTTEQYAAAHASRWRPR